MIGFRRLDVDGVLTVLLRRTGTAADAAEQKVVDDTLTINAVLISNERGGL